MNVGYSPKWQVLSITADNASNNDTMFAYLERVLVDFPGSVNQTQSFMHTINLCVKLILKHFDLPKNNDNNALDCVANALADLVDGIDHEAGRGQEKGNNDKEEADNNKYSEAWACISKGLVDNKLEELNLSIQPGRSILAKVCHNLCNQKKKFLVYSYPIKLQKLAFNLKNSPTILLPVWYKTLATHHYTPRMMPYDVTTCWNSTFDMLESAVDYHVAINTMTAAHDFGLHQYKLLPAEWKVACKLWDILKVRVFPLL
jgi:hypothetical protein